MSALLQLAHRHPKVFAKNFLNWLPDNEHMYRLFENLADQLWLSGRQHYSSRTIGEKMRFDCSINSKNDLFKLNNNYTPDLGRLYVLKHPERVLLFSYRRISHEIDFVEYVCKTFNLTIVPLDLINRKVA